LKFTELELKDAYLIELEPFFDERGMFSRQFCKREFEAVGIDFEICQCNVSANKKAGTLRGMHYQTEPYAEPKLVSCITGAFIDVIIDLRETSPTYLKYEKVELKENDHKILYVPPNFAHGFKTLVDNTIVYYQLGNYFMIDYYKGLRYNDPKIGIDWGNTSKIIINERDNSYELL